MLPLKDTLTPEAFKIKRETEKRKGEKITKAMTETFFLLTSYVYNEEKLNKIPLTLPTIFLCKPYLHVSK